MATATHFARVITTFAVLCIATSCTQNSGSAGSRGKNMQAGSKCPVTGAAVRPTAAGAMSNQDWWPNQLNLERWVFRLRG